MLQSPGAGWGWGSGGGVPGTVLGRGRGGVGSPCDSLFPASFTSVSFLLYLYPPFPPKHVLCLQDRQKRKLLGRDGGRLSPAPCTSSVGSPGDLTEALGPLNVPAQPQLIFRAHIPSSSEGGGRRWLSKERDWLSRFLFKFQTPLQPLLSSLTFPNPICMYLSGKYPVRLRCPAEGDVQPAKSASL